jgi:predicted ribosome quality control (RQC) complex YloA/Tae2 family protein
MRNHPLPVIGLFLLASCASLSPEQCKNADWRQIGYADGANGAPGSRIQEHASACAKIDAKPDMEAYLSGRMEGLVSYCQPENGFDVGRRGATDNAGDCPPHVRAAFLKNYRQGREIGALENQIAGLRSNMENERREMRRREDRIEDLRKELRRPNVNNERRGALLGEMERLIERKQDTLGRQIALQREMDIVQQRLAVRLREMGR